MNWSSLNKSMHIFDAPGKKKISKEKMAEIQAKIDADRRALESKKDMAEEERNKVKEDLDKKENELKKYKLVLLLLMSLWPLLWLPLGVCCSFQ